MRINHNITALNTYRQFNNANNAQAKSMEKLSSGQRINSASDDAAGLAISEKMRGQIRGLDQASRNAQDGVSLIQTAEGALNETHDILQRMRELVVQAGNGTNKTEDLDAIQDEIGSLIEEIGGEDGSKGISDRSQFNGRNLLDGTLNVTLQIGANAGQQVNLTIGDMSAEALSVNSIDVTDFSTTTFDEQLATIDGAINQVSEQRSGLGATQNRLDHTINNLSTSSENLTASESRIRDVDYALAV
ncbi:flagellin [Priestia aryabhattai]|uniref:flagellin N-terminal helical domain-containing protein n=1 Tax=Priestia aryabhattai TaxID=412384 RepID=UPI000BEF63D1|nr:flagellin [Priestia aryabhattai]PEI59067.1 flagellin [Priestia aryabhattai]